MCDAAGPAGAGADGHVEAGGVYIPVTLFLAGRRRMAVVFSEILPMGVHADLDVLLHALYAELDRVLRENPAAWHFWGGPRRFFTRVDTDNVPSNELKD